MTGNRTSVHVPVSIPICVRLVNRYTGNDAGISICDHSAPLYSLLLTQSEIKKRDWTFAQSRFFIQDG